nr:pyridoxamine 5'-phosphate oxidase family protein [Motilibacter deserti]
MCAFVERQEMLFVGTADRHGECDCSFRAGPPGFVRVLGPRVLAYPEYRGNGVMASLGNLQENPHVGLVLIDFFRDVIGLHVNGTAQVVPDEALRAATRLPEPDHPGRVARLWVVVDVEEAYIHCAKHIPLLTRLPRQQHWGTDDHHRKGGDFFGAKAERATQTGLAAQAGVSAQAGVVSHAPAAARV